MRWEEQVQDLDEAAVLAIASELADAAREQSGSDPEITEAEARLALATFLEEFSDVPPIDAAALAPEGDDATPIARRLLTVAAVDPVLGPKARDLIENPPVDEQMSADLLIPSAVVMTMLITWLQTQVDLKIQRERGKTNFSFSLRKGRSDASTVQELAKAFAKMLTGT